METTALKYRIKTALDESRMLILGSQVFIDFQYRTVFEPVFEKLPVSSQMLRLGSLVIMLLSSKYVHLVSLCLMAPSMIFLMSPAAFHRIVEKGENTERMVRFAGGMLLVLLPLGISGDFFVVVRKVTSAPGLAIVASMVVLVCFYALWFGYTSYRRSELNRAH